MSGVYLQSRRRTRLIKVAVWAAVLGLLLGVLSSLALATGADAHASLISIAPANRARLTTAPTRIVLTFDEPISSSFATVTVTDGSGASVGAGRADVQEAVVTQRLSPGLTSGRYTVAFRVVSEDGHPVSDRTTFTLALPAGAAAPGTSAPAPTMTPLATATASAAPASDNAAAASSPSDSTPMRLGLAVGVGALALAAGTALVAFSRRSRAS